MSVRVGRWGEAGNNGSRDWGLGRGREWMDLHHVRVKVWRGGRCIAVVEGKGGRGLNVIHGRADCCQCVITPYHVRFISCWMF